MEGSMEIKKDSKIKNIFKRYGKIMIVAAIAFVVAFVAAVGVGVKDEGEEVSTDSVVFALPMQNAVVVKDYADNYLQFNESLNRWEIHLAVDMIAENPAVFSIYDGVVLSIDENSLDGCVVKIQHEDGFVSEYSSMSQELMVKQGDNVKKGQLIGKSSDSAANEMVDGAHLHFAMYKDGVEIDPNIYLDLQNK